MNNNKKESIMNKMTKLGVTALCGSLATVSSANAGSLSVAGGIDMTWISMDQEVTGNPIGIGSNYTLSGAGELDNGWSVGLDILMKNKGTYSNTDVSVTVPAIGAFVVSNGVSGTGIDRMDDKTPNVWEEAYASGLSTGIQTVYGGSGGTGIEWTPNMLPDGLAMKVHWSPNADGSNNNDKASSGAGSSSSYDVTLELGESITGMAGLNIYGGIANVESKGDNYDGDREEQTIGATYAIGGFTLGYQWSEQDLGASANEQQYDNEGYGITFAINDDLSIGYNNYESKQTSTTNVTAEANSVQIAYSMGGASIRIMDASATNMDYDTGTTQDRDNTVISVALAF
jgi:outer membrane protein OmpU